MSATAFKVGKENWALSVNPKKTNPATAAPTEPMPIALHFVVDNSKSMGKLSKEVISTFADMVDRVASAPSSLTVFDNSARVLSSTIERAQQMRDLNPGLQGRTNIPAGVEKSLGVILKHDRKGGKTSDNNSNNCNNERVHHVMILLTDGQHNSGIVPKKAFPSFRDRVFGKNPDLNLSVVVVGFSRNSSTVMGMLLKTAIETVPLDPDMVQSIYFATSRDGLRQTMKKLSDGLADVAKGCPHTLVAATPCFVQDIDQSGQNDIRVHQRVGKSVHLLCHGESPPTCLLIDGIEVKVSICDQIETSVLEAVTKTLLSRARVRSIAGRDSFGLRLAVERLGALVSVLEANMSSEASLDLTRQTPTQRLQQFKDVRRACQGVRELRNHLMELANFNEADSEAQAHFLTGNTQKFAAKARRRAAQRMGGDGIISPAAERKAVLGQICSTEYTSSIKEKIKIDVYTNLARLACQEGERKKLITAFRQSNGPAARYLEELYDAGLSSILEENDKSSIVQAIEDKLSPSALAFVAGDKIPEMLNERYHGARQSYLSLTSPIQHVADWSDFENASGQFSTLWEALLFGGVVGYPISLERPAGAQMNPFLAEVTGIHTSLIDTASLCCARQSQVDVYGPEGGKPLEDVLVLVDPSCPLSSRALARGRLIGEKYTSAVIARDLHMYTGCQMQAALHANALFYLIAGKKKRDEQEEEARIIADTQRLVAHIGTAYECPKCEYGPVLHGGCGDLRAHHGERFGNGTASNACPRCAFFTSSLSGWNNWSGKFAEGFLEDAKKKRRKNSPSKPNRKNGPQDALCMESAVIDLVLRILYSFRKMAGPTVMETYEELASRMFNWDFRLTTKDGVDSLVQIILAIVVSDGAEKSNKNGDRDEEEKLDGNKIQQSLAAPALLEIVKEACVRDARKRFRMVGCGDELTARAAAQEHVTRLLSVTDGSAPYTKPLLEAEPDFLQVKNNASKTFVINTKHGEKDMDLVEGIASLWSTAFAFVKEFRYVLDHRGGGWDKLERDMETGIAFYEDFIRNLQGRVQKTTVDFDEIVPIPQHKMRNMMISISARAALKGMNCLTTNVDDEEPAAILGLLARDMRMLIYLDRVKEKMMEFRNCGQELLFQQAKMADWSQYIGMLAQHKHIHGFTKQEFWAYWNAAAANPDKPWMAEEFLKTAAEGFATKHVVDGKCYALGELKYSNGQQHSR